MTDSSARRRLFCTGYRYFTHSVTEENGIIETRDSLDWRGCFNDTE